MSSLLWRISLFALLLASAAPGRPGHFTIVGPGGGGAMFRPVVSPLDPDTVVLSCDMTGAYITHDGGQSWRMFNLRGVVEFFVFDPQDRNIIYAESDGLWRSDNVGETWNYIYPKPSAVKGIQMNSDHSDEEVIADPDPIGVVTALAVDPADSNVLYVAGGKRKARSGALFVSRDKGASWEKTADLPGLAKKIWVEPASPKDARKLLIAGASFLEIGTASGLKPFPALPVKSIQDISAGFTQNGSSVIYVVGDGKAFVSRDAGANWQAVDLGSAARIRAVAASLHHPEAAYVSYRGLEEAGIKWMGVAKTADSGQTWKLVWKEDSNPAGKPGKNIHDAWITERFGSDWGENPLTLGVADQNPNLAYGTDLGRTMKTADGGGVWTAVYSKKSSDGGWVSTGLDVTTSYGYHFDPFNPNRQFITYTDIGLFRSEDGGKSWMSSTKGVPPAWVNTTYWIVFDPKVPGRVWSVNSGTHDLPRPKMWRHTSVGTYRGGVCLSLDGGRTWTKSNEGMEQTAATHILLDSSSPVDARVLYVTGFGRGVYKSTDGGKSWELKNTGIAQSEPFAWRLAQDAKGMLYVIIARRSEDGSIGAPGDGALYRSSDGAEHWTPVNLPADTNGPNGLAIDPADPSRLYLAMWARAQGEHGEGGGIFLSEDAGNTWRRVLDRDRHVYDVSIDPRDARILYATGFESSAWRSTDRGEHWTRIPGFNFKWGHRVIPDPQHPNMIYITTFGGGVWHGSVNGEDRPVDIATPELQPGR